MYKVVANRTYWIEYLAIAFVLWLQIAIVLVVILPFLRETHVAHDFIQLLLLLPVLRLGAFLDQLFQFRAVVL